MNLQLVLTTALLAISMSSAQAFDTSTPDILSSVSNQSVQTMSKADSAKTRGEYVYCTGQWNGYYVSR